MVMSKEAREEVTQNYQVHQKDTGSPEVQVAILTSRILYLTEHFKKHHKDFHSKRGLLKLVNRRRKLLKYLSGTSRERYQSVIDRLGLRK